MKRLKWKNLLDNKCPQCGDYLQFYPLEKKMMCDRFGCEFMIREEGMARMVAKLSKKAYEEKHDIFEENMDALNNMGSSDIQDYQEED